jgi:ABC-2 type transport system ATP-binding protein
VIEVSRLSKWYGDFQAIKDISFSVTGSQVAGFLGANGAGKTTTMRILACYLPATTGKAAVAGFDVFTDSLRVRQALGYMPQAAPLYGDMRVAEYLRFMAEMRDIPMWRVRSAVDEAMEKSGLLRPDDMHRRLVGTLSGGYRQRVALAATLLHKPKVLILDEPTAGLDPVEIRNTRNTIKALGEEHTVLLSTHILSEVQQICRKVIIIRNGHVVADSPIDELVRTQGRGRLRLSVAGPAEAAAEALKELEPAGVTAVEPDPSAATSGTGAAADKSSGGIAAFTLTHDPARDPRPEIARRLADRRLPVLEMAGQTETLEDIYVRMTQAER